MFTFEQPLFFLETAKPSFSLATSTLFTKA